MLLSQHVRHLSKICHSMKVHRTDGVEEWVHLQPLIIGDLKYSVQSSNHDGWLKCDGSQLLVNDYLELYNIIGNIYGGNNYVFYLPDLKICFIKLNLIVR